VLQFTFPPAQWSTSNATGNLYFPGPFGGSFSGGNWLPTELYAKIVLRVPQSTWENPNGHIAYLNILSAGPGNPTGDSDGQWFNQIGQESWFDTSPPYHSRVGIDTYPAGPSGGGTKEIGFYPFPVSDHTAYHTLEVLYTSDESSAYWQCFWYDANATYTTGFLGCQQPNYMGQSIPHMTQEHDYMYYFGVGMQGTPAAANNEPIFIKSIDFWVCPGSPARSCPGTMITTWPQ
jgi:hypothetical protein